MGRGSAEMLLPKSRRHLALQMAWVVARDREIHKGSPPKRADSNVKGKCLWVLDFHFWWHQRQQDMAAGQEKKRCSRVSKGELVVQWVQ